MCQDVSHTQEDAPRASTCCFVCWMTQVAVAPEAMTWCIQIYPDPSIRKQVGEDNGGCSGLQALFAILESRPAESRRCYPVKAQGEIPGLLVSPLSLKPSASCILVRDSFLFQTFHKAEFT